MRLRTRLSQALSILFAGCVLVGGCAEQSLGSYPSAAGASVGGAGGEAGTDRGAPTCGVVGTTNAVDCGDVNRDWEIDEGDALLIAQYAEGLGPTIWLTAADVDCDGSITEADAIMVSAYVVGNISEFPCGPNGPRGDGGAAGQ
jgi:hypothetical protein